MDRAWTQSHDVRALLEAIEGRQFTALSVGIGLGELKPVVRQPKRSPEVQALLAPRAQPGLVRPSPSMAMGTAATRPTTATMGRPAAAGGPVAKASAGASPAASGFSRRLLAYGLDFVFVAITLAVGFAMAATLEAIRSGETDDWTALRPVQWAIETSPYALLGGLYGAFLAYGLLFRVLAGRTCGEMILRMGSGRGRQKRRAPSTAPRRGAP